MKTSNFLTRLRTASVVILFVPALASAQSDTITVSGTFQPTQISEGVGPELQAVYSSGQLHTWTLTMQDVTYEHDYFEMDPGTEYFQYYYSTRAHSNSFVLEFFGPDAEVLNSVVSDQLSSVSVELGNGSWFEPGADPYNGWPYMWFVLEAQPADLAAGVEFYVSTNNQTEFAVFDYPTFEPQEIRWTVESIFDHRSGGYGAMYSYSLAAYINSPIPPPTTTSVSIADASKLEGNRGTQALSLTVSLSSPASETVSVQYQTIDGTATSIGTKKSPADYSAASGTLTFQPGQTSKTISVQIIGDRKREANETFTLQLSNAVGANISDATATATILNDD